MARSLSNTKVLATSLADAIAPFSVFRGYAAVSHGGISGNLSAPVRKIEDRPVGSRSAVCEAYTAWAPDPITGYYRPVNCPLEVDPAKLREMLLSHRVIGPVVAKRYRRGINKWVLLILLIITTIIVVLAVLVPVQLMRW